jgi:hypothetical protein
LTFNQGVARSIRAGLTKQIKDLDEFTAVFKIAQVRAVSASRLPVSHP